MPDSQEVGLSPYWAMQAPVPDEVEDTEDDEYFEDEVELINDLATGSNAQYAQKNSSAAVRSATPADASFVQNDGIMLLSSYTPYDSSMSTSVVAYFDAMAPKLGLSHYVLFRSGQYTYRLFYSEDLEYVNGTFSGADGRYFAYDTRNYTWSDGVEINFTLRAGSYLVYSDLGDYPMLVPDSVGIYLVAFCAVLYLLYVIIRAFLAAPRLPF